MVAAYAARNEDGRKNKKQGKRSKTVSRIQPTLGSC